MVWSRLRQMTNIRSFSEHVQNMLLSNMTDIIDSFEQDGFKEMFDSQGYPLVFGNTSLSQTSWTPSESVTPVRTHAVHHQFPSGLDLAHIDNATLSLILTLMMNLTHELSLTETNYQPILYQLLLNLSEELRKSNHSSVSSADQTHESDKLYQATTSVVVLLFIFYGVISLVAVVGNVVVMWVVATSGMLHSVINYFIANLALADVIIGLFSIPFQFQAALLQRWSLPRFLCAFCPFFQTVSVNVSIFTLTAIAVDRYRAIVHPLAAKPTRTRSMLVLAAVWLVSGLLAMPMAIALRVKEMVDERTGHTIPTCYPINMGERVFALYSHALVGVQYFLPLGVISFAYLQIARRLWGARPPGNAQQARDAHLLANNRKAIKMLFVVVALFAVCWLPLQAYAILSTIFPSINQYKYINIVWFCSHWLAMSNSCLNPFVYAIYNEKFKRELRHKFRCCLREHVEGPPSYYLSELDKLRPLHRPYRCPPPALIRTIQICPDAGSLHQQRLQRIFTHENRKHDAGPHNQGTYLHRDHLDSNGSTLEFPIVNFSSPSQPIELFQYKVNNHFFERRNSSTLDQLAKETNDSFSKESVWVTSLSTVGVTSLSTLDITPLPIECVTTISTVGVPSPSTVGVTLFSTEDVTSLPTVGVTTLSTVGVTLMSTVGVNPLSGVGVTSLSTVGVTPLSTVGVTRPSTVSVPPLSTEGVIPLSAVSVTPISTVGVSPLSKVGITLLSTACETPLPTVGVTSIFTEGVTSLSTACVTPLSTLDVTAVSTVAVTTLSTMGEIPLSTVSATPLFTEGVTPLSTFSVPSISTVGVTPLSTACLTPLSTVGVTPLSAVSIAPLSTVGVTPLPAVGVTPLSTVGGTTLSTATDDPSYKVPVILSRGVDSSPRELPSPTADGSPGIRFASELQDIILPTTLGCPFRASMSPSCHIQDQTQQETQSSDVSDSEH